MKRIKYYLSAVVLGALTLNSCSDSIYDINVDPNNPTTVVDTLVLPAALAQNAFVFGGYYQHLGAYWTQQYAQAPAASQWADLETYNLNNADYDRQFTTMYNGALIDYQYIRDYSAKKGNWSFYAIATLMQAYSFQVMADLYDQIPFREALQGNAFLQPHYDGGALIYDSLLVRIDDAMSKDFDALTVLAPGNNDLIFKGNMNSWAQFANTLKLKMYLRYVNVDPTKYTAEIQALLAENNFLTTDAAFSAFTSGINKANPFWNTFIDRLAGNVVLNNTLGDTLKALSDPRLALMFKASETGSTMNGMNTGTSLTVTGTYKNFAMPAISATYPVYFFTAEESYFLQAEAEARYGSALKAQTLYENGVKKSLTRYGLAANAFTYPYNGVKSIIEQKWVASVNKTSIEAYFDLNRTGYPSFMRQSTTSVLLPGERPLRLFFPQSEKRTNANTPAQVALTTKVWWGK
jgi:hypothetical protein